MALVKLDDGKKYIENFNTAGNTITQDWKDPLGISFLNEMYEVMTAMNACMTQIEAHEATMHHTTDLFLQECGGSATASDTDYDTAEKLLQEIRGLLDVLVSQDDSDSSSSGSNISMNPQSADETAPYESCSNLDGTMLGGAPVYQGYDFEEYTEEAPKVKRR